MALSQLAGVLGLRGKGCPERPPGFVSARPLGVDAPHPDWRAGDFIRGGEDVAYGDWGHGTRVGATSDADDALTQVVDHRRGSGSGAEGDGAHGFYRIGDSTTWDRRSRRLPEVTGQT